VFTRGNKEYNIRMHDTADTWQSVRTFAQFCTRLTLVHFFSYVLVGGISYMLNMRYRWGNIPPEITSPHVQFWIWPPQLFRGLVLASVLYPLRTAFLRMGRLGGLAVAGLMIGIGCLAGFNSLIENLIFYRTVSLYQYYIRIPEILAQTMLFGYLLV
jgi:hypothetical protein